MKIYMNGIKTNLREIREHLELMSELGYRFKQLPSFDGVIKFKAELPDNPLTSKEYHIVGTSFTRIFSQTELPLII